jgi:hypothetical protein
VHSRRSSVATRKRCSSVRRSWTETESRGDGERSPHWIHRHVPRRRYSHFAAQTRDIRRVACFTCAFGEGCLRAGNEVALAAIGRR